MQWIQRLKPRTEVWHPQQPHPESSPAVALNLEVIMQYVQQTSPAASTGQREIILERELGNTYLRVYNLTARVHFSVDVDSFERNLFSTNPQ